MQAVDREDGEGVECEFWPRDGEKGGALQVCNSFPLNGRYPTGQRVIFYTSTKRISLSLVTIRI
jgi:hypothetical protein